MLVLSRRRDQTLVIGDNVEVTVLEIKGGQVRLGINAPKAIPVHRGEIHAKVIEDRYNLDQSLSNLKVTQHTHII